MSSVTTTSSMEAADQSSSPEEHFDTRLSLGLGGGVPKPPVVVFGEVFPAPQQQTTSTVAKEEGGDHHGRRAAARRGTARARWRSGSAVRGEEDRRNPSDGGGARKKLRLTGEQAAMLEDSFRAHNILSHAQKQDLARRLGLSARQVEVWFQNRRARTKLKQTEADCVVMRRWCDRLTDENARLRHELADLRSSSAVNRIAAAMATAVVCPSCDGHKLALVAGGH